MLQLKCSNFCFGVIWMIKAAVFDLDHTLFDRYGTIRNIAPDLVEDFDVSNGVTADVFAEALIYADKHYVHLGWKDVYACLIEKNIFKTIPPYEVYVETLLKNFRKTTVEYDFAIPVLKEIREMGIKTALITNGDPKLQHFKITSLNLDDQFEEIIVSGETPFAKPDPKIFRLMAEKLGIDTSEMMYIGDHPLNDIEGSRNAGCVPVWVKTTGVWAFPEIEKPQLQVETVRDVPELLKTLNER